MKETSVYSRGISFAGRKALLIWNRIRTLTASQILMSVFCGIISHGTLLGIVKPFGPAFYAAFSGSTVVKVLMMLFIFLWNFVRGDVLAALKLTAVILLYEWIKKIFIRNEDDLSYMKNSLLISAATAVTGIFVFFINGQILESVLIIIIETILTCILAVVFATTVHGQETSGDGSTEHKNTEYIGILALGGAFLLGISGIRIIWFSIDRIIAGLSLLMLTRHLGPGFGACAGCMAGLALSAGYPYFVVSLAGIYGVSGMTAGLFHKSKVTSGSVFFLTQFIFITLSSDISMNYLDAVIPTILFIVIPDLRTVRVLPIKNRIEHTEPEAEITERIRHFVSDRIGDMAKALYKLAHTLEKQMDDGDLSGEEISNSVIEHMTQKVCSLCNKSVVCWEQRLMYTYSVMCNLIDSMQEGTDSAGEAEKELNRFCVKQGMVLDVLSRTIEIKRVDRLWQRILYESRSFIPEQIYGLSEILMKLSGEVFNNIKFYSEEEKNIEAQLKKHDFPVIKTEVKRGDNGRFHVAIHFEGCRGRDLCRKTIEDSVTKILGVTMVMEDDDCKNCGRDLCTLVLREKENLGVIIGISKLKKNRASVSGDSFSFLQTDDGKYVVALSDGMGSGSRANKLSETAVSLFEQLVDCGVSVRLSLNLVNMLISVKNSEKYATMDVASIDLYTGETEFYKMGAMPSLVLSGKNMDYIQINNLPAGLNRNNPVQYEKRKLSDGEFIIMMTDGVYEKLSEGFGEKFLDKIVSFQNTLNPQEMADVLLKKACGDIENISDDMTVLVAKVWRKAG